MPILSTIERFRSTSETFSEPSRPRAMRRLVPYRSRLMVTAMAALIAVGGGIETVPALFGQDEAVTTVKTAPATEKPNQVDGIKQEEPAYRGLDANLYMQTSAEYRAACLQAFHWAKRLVNEKLVTRIAATQRSSRLALGPNSESLLPGKPPAVILDLDETVLDNRAFQTKQIREGWAYSQDYWSKFEQEGGPDIVAVPGAVEFIRHIKVMGIQPVYITNRNARAHKPTMEVLKRLGIEVPDEWLLCADAETKSNKDSRRTKVREQFDVLLLVGDNLRDFEDFFKYDGANGPAKGIDARLEKVDEYRHKFGAEWVLLPNPAYGEWNKALGNGKKDADLLVPRQP